MLLNRAFGRAFLKRLTQETRTSTSSIRQEKMANCPFPFLILLSGSIVEKMANCPFPFLILLSGSIVEKVLRLYRVAPQKTEQSIFYIGLCSDQQLSFPPCWIEHLFLIIITPRSSNSVEIFFIL